MWKIYINYGTQAEMELADSNTFKTKKDASVWAKEHGYPQKCVMRAEEYSARKESEEQIVIQRV